MVSTNYDKTFDNLRHYDTVMGNVGYFSDWGQAVIWIKKENGERFLEVSRITGLWNKIRTIGFVNTVKSWFNRGDASLPAVIHFLNRDHVKRELKVRYLNLIYIDLAKECDRSIDRLNSQGDRYNLDRIDLGITQAEKAKFIAGGLPISAPSYSVQTSHTVNGVTTSFSGTFSGPCHVHTVNGRTTVNGRPV